ncbi:D-2-hydroxyacid dehydrogenase, partial [Lactobacillus parabuchneri]|nr:D-2-hydroxyacid dehydrogenase [Lentilactobacillus parabuchneri]
MPNVLITPHSAFHTSEAVRNMIDISLSNLVSLNNGDKPKDLVD